VKGGGGHRPAPVAVIAAVAVLLARGGGDAAPRGLDLVITSPAAGEAVFGEVDFSVEVYPAGAAARVEFLLDGEPVGEAAAPPYAVRLSVGEENREHRFEARAVAVDGRHAEALLVSPAIPVDAHVEAELRQLYVTVTAAGSRVLDLAPEDFTILDDGAPQELVTFARGEVRITAVLLVDASFSMQGRPLRFALDGAADFVRGLSAEDDAALWVFSDQLLHATPFTNDLGVLTAGLAGTVAAGGTALNDHLYRAVKELESRQGRRVVVILSDGVDSDSALRMDEAAWLVRRSRSLVYWIRTAPWGEGVQRYSAWKDAERYRAEYDLLGATVVDSGGRILDLGGVEEAGGAFRELLRELREQYVLGYQPAARHDGRWRANQVGLRRPGLTVRTQAGYVDD
jgi:Ca-activated chloride channel homolog